MGEEIGAARMVAARIADAAEHVPATSRKFLDAVQIDDRISTIAMRVAVGLATAGLEPVENPRRNADRLEHGLVAAHPI